MMLVSAGERREGSLSISSAFDMDASSVRCHIGLVTLGQVPRYRGPLREGKDQGVELSDGLSVGRDLTGTL